MRMNRVMSRSRVLMVLVLILALGLSFFLGEYALNSGKWVHSAGSPHIYNADNIGCGQIADRDGNLLLDLTGTRTYSNSALLRMSTLHWIGDRQGNISAPALSHYAKQIAGFDPFSGLYAYGGVGGQVQLTLSAQLQMAALEAMGDYKGTLAIMNYNTGELLCAVTTPTYDPDDVPDIAGDTSGAYKGVYLNRFTQSTYTPGSIFKIVTMIAALECIADIETQEFTCTGELAYGVDKVTCERVHGKQNIRDAFKNSCNCAFAKVSEQIGGKRLARYAQQLGVLDPLEFDGIKTAAGNIDSADRAEVLVAWSAIGQHKDLVNPASFLNLVSAVANGGIGQRMHLVDSIQTGLTTTYEAKPASSDRLMSTQTAQTLQELMRNNVENYYGDENFAGFTVCAKSGTAEVGGDLKPNAMFTGFLTDEEYPLAFIVTIENGGYGRLTCVPVLEKVLLACRDAL